MPRSPFRTRARPVALTAAMLFALAPMHVLSADAAPSVRFEYSADDGCPDKPAFLSEVFSRVQRRGELSETLVVKARIGKGDNEKYQGTVVFSRGEQDSERQVEGSSCQEVVEALAVVVALTIDPPRVTPQVVVPVSQPEHLHDVPPQPASPSTRWRAALGLGGGLTSAAVPWPAGYGELSLELRRPSRTPAFRVGLLYATRRDYATDEGSSSFDWIAGEVEACPVALLLGATLALEPGVGLQVGALQAKGRTLLGTESRWTAWVAPETLLRLRWNPAGHLSLALVAAGVFPLVRKSFYLETPEQTAFRAPAVGFRGGLEATLHF